MADLGPLFRTRLMRGCSGLARKDESLDGRRAGDGGRFFGFRVFNGCDGARREILNGIFCSCFQSFAGLFRF